MAEKTEKTKEELQKEIDDLNQKLKEEREQYTSELKELKKDKPLSLAEKIAQASGDMGAIAKDGINQGQGGWQFISESAIKAAVRKAMKKYGFAIIPKEIKDVTKYERRTAKGSSFYFYDVTQVFLITDGTESFEAEMIGTGSDSGDKAVNKAVTMAFKNLEKQLFNVSDKSEEDPDSETAPETTTTTQTSSNGAKKKPTKKDLENYPITYKGVKTTMGILYRHYQAGEKDAVDFANSLSSSDKFVFENLKQME